MLHLKVDVKSMAELAGKIVAECKVGRSPGRVQLWRQMRMKPADPCLCHCGTSTNSVYNECGCRS